MDGAGVIHKMCGTAYCHENDSKSVIIMPIYFQLLNNSLCMHGFYFCLCDFVVIR